MAGSRLEPSLSRRTEGGALLPSQFGQTGRRWAGPLAAQASHRPHRLRPTPRRLAAVPGPRAGSAVPA